MSIVFLLFLWKYVKYRRRRKLWIGGGGKIERKSNIKSSNIIIIINIYAFQSLSLIIWWKRQKYVSSCVICFRLSRLSFRWCLSILKKIYSKWVSSNVPKRGNFVFHWLGQTHQTPITSKRSKVYNLIRSILVGTLTCFEPK